MSESDNQIEEALERAETPKRPSDLPNDGTESQELPQDEAGFKRPTRVEHTSEKEHPPGKE